MSLYYNHYYNTRGNLQMSSERIKKRIRKGKAYYRHALSNSAQQKPSESKKTAHGELILDIELIAILDSEQIRQGSSSVKAN
jgi:hypothetical protein